MTAFLLPEEAAPYILRLAFALAIGFLIGLERGWREGPALGTQLAAAFEAQLDGAFTDLDGALARLTEHGAGPD